MPTFPAFFFLHRTSFRPTVKGFWPFISFRWPSPFSFFKKSLSAKLPCPSLFFRAFLLPISLCFNFYPTPTCLLFLFYADPTRLPSGSVRWLFFWSVQLPMSLTHVRRPPLFPKLPPPLPLAPSPQKPQPCRYSTAPLPARKPPDPITNLSAGSAFFLVFPLDCTESSSNPRFYPVRSSFGSRHFFPDPFLSRGPPFFPLFLTPNDC